MTEANDPQEHTSHAAERPIPFELLRQMDFFQAVRLLQVLLRGDAPRTLASSGELNPIPSGVAPESVAAPSAPPVGLPGPLTAERLRFRVSPSMTFPNRDLASVEWATPRQDSRHSHVVLTTHFLGLIGSDSPLPLSYVQEVLTEDEEHPQLRAFLDLFHHRLLSLLFRTWQKPRVEQEPLSVDGLLRQLAALVGLTGSRGIRVTDSLVGAHPSSVGKSGMVAATPECHTPHAADPLSLRHQGLFSLSTRPAEGLRLLFEEVLNMPVKVIPFRLRRVEIPPSERFRFGTPGQARQLSQNLVLGRRIWDRSGAITVELGPVRQAQLSGFEPGAPLVPELLRRAALYLEHPLEIRLELRVPPEEMPRVRLGGRHKTRLGRLAVLTRARREVRVRLEV